jgi:Uncharacterised nucleotidyltransferase
VQRPPESLTPDVLRLAALLQGSCTILPSVIDRALVDRAIAHGVAPLLYRALRDGGHFSNVPAGPRRTLQQVAGEALIYDALQRRDLQRLLADLHADGSSPLVFKGAALAGSHYAESWLRPRGDVDLLVSVDQFPAVADVLERRGFVRAPRPAGPRVAQARFIGHPEGAPIAYDVHWRLAEPLVFAGCLPFDALDADAVVDAETGARRLCDVHALLAALVHRVAHHHDSDNLLMLYDVDRLARGLDACAWHRLADLASQWSIGGVCGRGLDLAREAFSSPVPEEVLGRLSGMASSEPASAWLNRPLSRIDLLRSDLVALPSWRSRLDLLRHHLFPAPVYLRAAYRCDERTWAGPLYAHRIARGIGRWIRPIESRDAES